MLQLAAKYEVRGLVLELTSYSSSTPGAGTIVNDVVLAYNSFGQLVSDSQSHSGSVVPGTTPLVQYAYENGSSNMIRPTTLTYPNGRAITISYGTVGGINNSSSQVDNLSDSSGTLVNYTYLGLGTPVQTTYPLINTQYTLLGSSSGNSPAGDIYWGLDLFDRIIDSRWYNTMSNADVDRIKYGYDRASNRIWRQNPVATAAGANFDEFYTNDGLQRLKDMQRGTLNGTNTGLSTKTFEQCWTLDPTGNWRGFNEASAGGSWTTVQTRSANPVNEITSIINTVGSPWATPAYDSAGNMTSIPQPANMSANYTATYDAWNRLVKLVDATTGNTVQQNHYDARTFRTVIQSYTGGVLSVTRHSYFTSNWQYIEERVGSATTADRQFVWGSRYIDDLVRRDRGTETLYAMQDANWNVTSIADTTGTVQERYAYSAYGSPTFLTNSFAGRPSSSFAWETLYGGYRCDNALVLYLARNRPYQPILGFWQVRDPAGYEPDINLYRYVHSRPLAYVDPTGNGEGWDDFWDVGFWNSQTASSCRDIAISAIKGMDGGWGGDADAVRHCIWLCCMTQKIGAGPAKKVADNHEKHNPTPKCKCPPQGYSSQEEFEKDDAAMDEQNNEFGMCLGTQDPKVKCTDACKDALKNGLLKVNRPDGYMGHSGCKKGGGY